MDMKIYAEGSAFKDGKYDLRKLETLISCQRRVLDKLALLTSGPAKSKPSKPNIDYLVEIKEGSIELLIDFIWDNKDLIPLLTIDGGHELSRAIVKLYRDAIDLRKQAAKIIERGIKVNLVINPNINIGGSQIVNSTTVLANEQTGTIEISDPKIFAAALSTRSAANGLIEMIDGKAIKSVNISAGSTSLDLTTEDRVVLRKHREELNFSINIVGRLDAVAFSSHRGVIVSEGNRYQLSWTEEHRSTIQKIADMEGITFVVRPIVDHNRLTDNAIAFTLVDCNVSQTSISEL